MANNVCVGTCFSYTVPQTRPVTPGDEHLDYCDSCTASEFHWDNVIIFLCKIYKPLGGVMGYYISQRMQWGILYPRGPSWVLYPRGFSGVLYPRGCIGTLSIPGGRWGVLYPRRYFLCKKKS